MTNATPKVLETLSGISSSQEILAESLHHRHTWSQNTLWRKDGVFYGKTKNFTCQSKKSLNRTSPEVRIRRSGSGELLVYRHLSSNDSDTSLEDRCIPLESLSWDSGGVTTKSELLSNFINSGLQVRIGWLRLNHSQSSACWQTLLSAPQATLNALSDPRSSSDAL